MITGLQAAGKTTVGRLLAERLGPPAAHFDGDVLLSMVVAGKALMTPTPSAEALRHLELRYQAGALLAQHYAGKGFDFVYSDIVLGAYVSDWLDSVDGAERHLIVLAPSVDAIVQRETARGGHNSYRDWQRPGGTLVDAVVSMGQALEETPRRGLWLDTSADTPLEAVDRILVDDMRASVY